MGIREQFEKCFPSSESPSYYPIGEECGDISPSTWREPPLPDDPELRERRIRLRLAIYEKAFGTQEERRAYGVKCLPFNELPPDTVERMPPALRESYETEFAVAMDPRSGRLVRPHEPMVVSDATDFKG